MVWRGHGQNSETTLSRTTLAAGAQAHHAVVGRTTREHSQSAWHGAMRARNVEGRRGNAG